MYILSTTKSWFLVVIMLCATLLSKLQLSSALNKNTILRKSNNNFSMVSSLYTRSRSQYEGCVDSATSRSMYRSIHIVNNDNNNKKNNNNKYNIGRRNNIRLFSSSEADTNNDLKSKVKVLWKQYGGVAVVTYLSVYICTLSSIFISLDYDIFNAATFGLDPNAAVKNFCDVVEYATGINTLPNYIRENPRVGTFALAWVMTKFTEPLRLGFTISIVPSIARFLGRAPPKKQF